MKHVIWIYVVLVFGAAVLMVVLNSKAGIQLVATRDIDSMQPLRQGDLTLRVDGVQFLADSVRSGAVIDASAVRTAKERTDAPVPVSVTRSIVSQSQITPQRPVTVCPTDVPAIVRSVTCGAPNEPCIAVVGVDQEDAEQVRSEADLVLSVTDSCP